MSALAVLEGLRAMGVSVRVVPSGLDVEGPKGALRADLLAALRENKSEIMGLLAQEAEADHLAATTRATMEAGAVPIFPVPWSEVLTCERCGPVPWGAEGQTGTCPWCWVGGAPMGTPGVRVDPAG